MFLVILSVLLRRLTFLYIWLLTDWTKVFETWYWPFLGWFFMPLTCLAYIAGILKNGQITGFWAFLMAFAIVGDIVKNIVEINLLE